MKIGFIKNAFGNMPHAVATEADGKIEVKSITEFGKSIINNFDFDKDNISSTLPEGFVFTGFTEKAIPAEFEQSPDHVKTKSLAYSCSFTAEQIGKKSAVSNISINKFTNSADKLNAISFKASAFKSSSRRGEFLARISSKKILFDQRLARVSNNPKFAFSHLEEEGLKSYFSDGFMRKTAQKTTLNRRAARRARVLSSMNEEEKSKPKKNILSRINTARKDVKNGR
jgi:hypothetical protein